MKLGVMSTLYQYIGLPVEEYLQPVKDLGLNYIDLMTINDLKIRHLDNERVKQVKKALDQSGLIPSCFIANVGGNGASSNEELQNKTIEAVYRAIDVASDLGFPLTLFFPGEKESGTPIEKSWENMKFYVDKLLTKAVKKNIILTFENNPRIFRMLNSTDEVVKLLDEFSSPNLKVTVDIGHLTIIRESPMEIRKLKGQVIHAHITDNDGTTDTNETLGTGYTPIAECLEELKLAQIEETAKQCGVEAVAVIELNSPEKISLKSSPNMLKRSLDYLKNELKMLNLEL